MRDQLIKFLATGFGVGMVPVAPGTMGSLLGVGYWWLLRQIPNPYLGLSVFVAGCGLAVWCAGEAATLMNHKDPAAVVIDEIVALPLALAGISANHSLAWQILAGFALFRLFDVWKPCPIRQSQRLPGGWGIVVDDLIAAVFAGVALRIGVWAAGLILR